MPFKSLQLSLLRSTVRKRILEIRENPKEGIANLLKLDALLSHSNHDTEDLLREAKAQLSDENSAYYRLVEALARQVELETLSGFGINLGYHAFSAGKKQIRGEAGFHVPWCLSLHLGDAALHLAPPLLARILAQGQALGIYCYQLILTPSYPAFDALLPVLRDAEDCACILLLPPSILSERRAAQLAALPNLLLLLDLDDGNEAALTAALTLTQGRLRGGFTRYTRLEETAPAALSRAATLGLPILALQNARGQEAAETEDGAYLEALRKNLPGPVFPLDLYADIARIDRAISGQAVLVSISPEGLLSWSGEGRSGRETARIPSEAGLKESLRRALAGLGLPP